MFSWRLSRRYKHLETRVVSCNGETCVRSNFFFFCRFEVFVSTIPSQFFFVDQTWWKQCMNSIRTFSNNIGKTFDMWCLKRNQRLGMTFLQDRITHLEFIHPPLIIFAALKNNHIIMFFECDSNNRKCYNVPCLYSTFRLLLADCTSLVMQGEIMKRLQVAKQYNVKQNKTLLAQGRRKVPLVQIRRDKGVQTGFFTGCHAKTISAVDSRSIGCNFVQNIRHSQ